MITKEQFIETKVLSDLALAKGISTDDIYDKYKMREYQQERVDYWYEQLLEGQVTAEYNDTEYDDATDLISELVDEGKSISSISKTMQLPYKTVEKYLTYIGETTTANADETMKPLLDELAAKRHESRRLFKDVSPLVKEERELKNKIMNAYANSFTKKKVKHNGVSVRTAKAFNKKMISTAELAKHFSDEKLKELFGIEIVDVIIIDHTQIDKQYKG